MNKLLTLILIFLSFNLKSQNFDIYVSDAGNFNNPPWQILKFDSNGQNPVQFINTNINWPQDILFLENSNTVLISNLGSNRITRHNASNGTYISDFASGISGPTRMKIGPDSMLYVLQWNGLGIVRRYDLAGNYLGDFTTVGVPRSIGLDWDSNGNLYVSSYNTDIVRKFDPLGNDLGIFISTDLLGPTNIWFDSTGDLLVSDYNGTAVKRFNSSGIYQGDFMTGLSYSEGFAYLPNGNILIGNGASSSVKMFDANGVYLQDLIPSGSGNLLNPNAVVLRNNSTSSITEIKTAEQIIIYPTVGKQFMITPEFISKVKSLEIFDTNGKKVETIDVGKSTLWNASKFAAGNYLIHINLKDRSQSIQKVMVQD